MRKYTNTFHIYGQQASTWSVELQNFGVDDEKLEF